MANSDVNIDKVCAKLQRALEASIDQRNLYQAVVDAPFMQPVEMALLFLGFLSFFLVDEVKQLIYLVGSSDNDYYYQSVEGYNFDPTAFRLKLDGAHNSIVRAVLDKQETSTEDWGSLGRPQAKDGAARLNQANAGIGYSVVYPLTGRVRGALLYNYFQEDAVVEIQQRFMQRYTGLVSAALDSKLG